MEAIFAQILKMSLVAGFLVPVVLLLRLCLQKAPRWLHCLLWLIVGVRLMIPSLPQSSVGLMPDTQATPDPEPVSTNVFSMAAV